ncbi:hypothetical protein JXQ31_11000 [candidate division KSB1 bacterium]|nr:hypothetical protein [candidate division KSB1 bacterium]
MHKNKYVVIYLLSVSLIALEIVWTRIFSAEFFYTFAFLILSLAVLGLGLGALGLKLFSSCNNQKHLWLILSFTALFASAGPPIALHIGMDYGKLFISWLMVGKFILTIILLSAPFFSGGIALAMLFKHYHRDIPRLYMADLLGAGSGVIISVLLMNLFGTPAAVFLVGIPVIISAIVTGKSVQRLLPALLFIVTLALIPYSEKIMEKPGEERAPVIYKHWDAIAKIKIYNYQENYRGINIDNAANSPVYGFDGNWVRPDSERFQFGISVKYLIEQYDSCTFMSLGAGGGVDVLQALQEGAVEIHAVEVNPHVNKLMLDGELAEFSGFIYKDPKVKVITEDARTYVRRFKNKFDVIYSLSSNTFAALASGSFALAENYLFTTGAFKDYYRALTDNGVMMMEHQFYMPRIVSEVLDALSELGIQNPQDHFAVYDLPQMRRNILLLSKRPLTEQVRQKAFGELKPENYAQIHLLYPAPDSTAGNLINRIVTEGWSVMQDSAKIDISPCTDNRPFTAQLGLWKNFNIHKLNDLKPWEFMGFPLSKLLIIIILLIIVILVLPLNLLPYAKKGKKLSPAGWLYFFCIGIAFMVVEIVLIQRYTLFIGSSSYTCMTILFTILIGSGIGSRMSVHFKNRFPFIAIILLLAVEIFVTPLLTSTMAGLNIYGRILSAIVFIFPVTFFMGMPFPKGSYKIGELIDWGFAVNGAASVLGSTAIMLVSFSYGFKIALMVGMLFYFIAFCLINLNTRM